jgi:hypothetical protein
MGSADELYDLRRGYPDFTVVPTKKEHFDMLTEKAFIDLLASLDIHKTSNTKL